MLYRRQVLPTAVLLSAVLSFKAPAPTATRPPPVTLVNKAREPIATLSPEVVFAVCVFADGTLIDHKGANSMSDCLKTKRLVEKKWRNKSDTTDSVEINGITYKIDGESLAFICDLVDARVHHYEDGSWEIIQILGKHKKEE